jgi:hypothetical protein
MWAPLILAYQTNKANHTAFYSKDPAMPRPVELRSIAHDGQKRTW